MTMKSLLFLFCSLFISIISNSQTFTDNFDTYTSGAYLAQSNSSWKTWSNSPGGADDVKITNTKAHSGANSIYFQAASAGGPSDIVLPFGSQYTSGTLNYSMWMFVDNGKKAYFNFQEQTTLGKGWSFDANFDSLGNLGFINTLDGSLLSLNYSQSQWFKIGVNVDLNTNTWEVFINDVSKGVFQNSYRSVSSIDIYDMAGCSFYIDDVTYTYTPLATTSLDASLTFIDKVQGLLATQVTTPTVEIRNLGSQVITSANVQVSYNGNNITKNVTGLAIPALGTYTITMDNSITIASGTHTLTATVLKVNGLTDNNGTNNSKSMVLNPIVPALNKLVIAEEATGTWCGWCPRGTVFLKNMDLKYPGLIQGIAVHNNDPMMDSAYNKGFGASSFPTVRVDRLTGIDPSGIEADFMKRVVLTPKSNIKNGATYNSSNGELKVSLSTKFNQAVSGNYKIACVLVEDSVTGTASTFNQSNYYAGGAKGVMGGFEILPNPVPAAQMVYDHVGRIISPSFAGYPNAFATTVNAGDSFVHNFIFTLNAAWNPSKIHIVGMVIDASGLTDNGSVSKISEAVQNGFISGKVVSGISLLDAPDVAVLLYPNPSTAQINILLNGNISGKTEINILDVSGKLIYTSNQNTSHNLTIDTREWNAGMYLVQVRNGNMTYNSKFIKQ